MLKFDNNTVISFDLDDTLYKEINFLKSGFKCIIEKYFYSSHEFLLNLMIDWFKRGDDVFQNLIRFKSNWQIRSNFTKDDLKVTYRYHLPDINLECDSLRILSLIRNKKIPIALITDGRSVTQRNKLKSLGISDLFDLIIISEEFGSEKPNIKNFKIVEQYFKNAQKFIYIADNPLKDFYAPNKLEWTTFCLLNDGRNIHQQIFDLPPEFLPSFKINSLDELISYF